MNSDKANYQGLIEALRLIAMPYQEQVDALPSFVSPADEIALIFDDSYKTVESVVRTWDVSDDVVQALTNLDRALNEMSDNRELWNLDALKNSVEWSKCRELAQRILIGLHEPLEIPNLAHVKFIK